MIFIAGITPKSKPLGNCRCVCPACGCTADLHLIKHYSVFTFFFIPVFPFGASYLATCPKCSSAMKLSKEKGKAFEQNPGSMIHADDLHIRQNSQNSKVRACPSCGAPIITNQNFCYHCGERL